MKQSMMNIEKRSLMDGAVEVNGVKVVKSVVKPFLAGNLKDLAFQLRSDMSGDMVALLGGEVEGKAQLAIITSESLVEKGLLNAVELVKAVSREIQGGGGGQAFFATAGGKNPKGLEAALKQAFALVREKLG
jgi:alanyl-tRNA synthetase